MKPEAPGRAELGVWIVGVAWQAPAAALAPFTAVAPLSGTAAASLIEAALADATVPGAGPPVFAVADGLAGADLGPDTRHAVTYHRTLVLALLGAVAALQAGSATACVVGASADSAAGRVGVPAAAAQAAAARAATAPASGAWLVLETAASARARGAAPYATLVDVGAAAAAETLPEPREAIGWLELPGGPGDGDTAERVFSATAEVLQSARRGALGSEIQGSVRDALALVRAALALGHKVLPRPMAAGAALRPWIAPLPHAGWAAHGAPRQAGWLAGETHRPTYVLLREERTAPARPHAISLAQELFVFGADSLAALRQQLVALRQQLLQNPAGDLMQLAYELSQQAPRGAPCRLAIVAGSLAELEQQLAECAAQLATGEPAGLKDLQRPGGRRYFGTGTERAGTTAFLFPGLGASYPYMLADLCVHFPAVREVFDSIDFVAAQLGEPILPSQQVFPATAEPQGDAESGAAVVTLLMAEWALAELLRELGVLPDVLMGCSTGEFAALCQGGAVDAVAALPIFLKLSLGVARALPTEQLAALQSVLLTAPASAVQPLLAAAPGALYLSADLGPDCTLLVGERPAVQWLVPQVEASGRAAHLLPRGIPYHTPLLRDAMASGAAALGALTITAPRLPIWSCATAQPYGAEPEEILSNASALFVRAIALRQTVEAMYSAGVRTFIEVGPGDGLCRRVDAILGRRPHLSLASNVQQRPGATQLLHLLAALHALGKPLDLAPLFRHRLRPQDKLPGPARPLAALPLPAPALSPSPRAKAPRAAERVGSALPALTLDLPWAQRWFCLWIDRSELCASESSLPLQPISDPREPQPAAQPAAAEDGLVHLAAKRAVQELLRQLTHRRIELSAIELRRGATGELRASGDFAALLGGEPTVAAAGCGDAAVALVAAPGLAAHIGVQISRAQVLPLQDAPTALCRALASDSQLAATAVQVTAVDPLTGWINLQAPGYRAALHARAFRVRNHFITLAVVPRSAA